MNTSLKIIWVCLIIFCIAGMLISIPAEKTQYKFKRAILRKRLAPLARLDATQKYLEDYEKGIFDDVYMFGDSPRLKTLYNIELDKKISEQEKEQSSQSTIRKPLYIRDRNNPNILYKYTDNWNYRTSSVRKFPNYTNIFRKFRSNSLPLYYDRNRNIYRPIYP